MVGAVAGVGVEAGDLLGVRGDSTGWSGICGAMPGAGVVSGLIGFGASTGATVIGCGGLPGGAVAAGCAVVGSCVVVGRKGREGIGEAGGEPGDTITGDDVIDTVGSGANGVGGVADGAHVLDGANIATGVGVASVPVLGLEVATNLSRAAGAVAAGAALGVGPGDSGTCETGRETTGSPVGKIEAGDGVGAGGATAGSGVFGTDMVSCVGTLTSLGVTSGVGERVELAPRSDVGDGVLSATEAVAGATVSGTTGLRVVDSCVKGALDGPAGKSCAALGNMVPGNPPLSEVGEGVSKTAGNPGFGKVETVGDGMPVTGVSDDNNGSEGGLEVGKAISGCAVATGL